MIRIPAAAWQAIAAAARAAYPEECCGLLVGVNADEDGAVRVTGVVATENVASPSRRDRFEIDPQRQFALLRALRGTREAIIGHYHSHPDAAAVPSAVDRQRILDPGLIWVIVAVDGERIEGAAWRPIAAGSGFAPMALIVGT